MEKKDYFLHLFVLYIQKNTCFLSLLLNFTSFEEILHLMNIIFVYFDQIHFN